MSQRTVESNVAWKAYQLVRHLISSESLEFKNRALAGGFIGYDGGLSTTMLDVLAQKALEYWVILDTH